MASDPTARPLRSQDRESNGVRDHQPQNIRRAAEWLESRDAGGEGRAHFGRRRPDRSRRRFRRAMGRRAGACDGGRAVGRRHAGKRRAHDLLHHGPRGVSRQLEPAGRGSPQTYGPPLSGDGRRRSEIADGLQGARRDRSGCHAMSVFAESFLYELDQKTQVATITLNRPERLNALTFAVYKELRDAFQGLDTEPGVRAIIITGAGRAFCSGGDVEDIIGALLGRDEAGLLEFTRLTCDLILALRQCRRPIVGALNGTVAGAGAVIAAACDVRIAVESAKIAFLFTKVGLSGADMGAAWLLPRIVGLGHATELLMTGDFIDAQTALRIGLYNRVVADPAVMMEARGLAERLARGPSVALGITKDALNREAHMDLVTALEAEARAQAGCMLSPNFRAAYEAFKAKREPKFV